MAGKKMTVSKLTLFKTKLTTKSNHINLTGVKIISIIDSTIINKFDRESTNRLVYIKPQCLTTIGSKWLTRKFSQSVFF